MDLGAACFTWIVKQAGTKSLNDACILNGGSSKAVRKTAPGFPMSEKETRRKDCVQLPDRSKLLAKHTPVSCLHLRLTFTASGIRRGPDSFRNRPSTGCVFRCRRKSLCSLSDAVPTYRQRCHQNADCVPTLPRTVPFPGLSWLPDQQDLSDLFPA
jgi:hypothetical protein